MVPAPRSADPDRYEYIVYLVIAEHLLNIIFDTGNFPSYCAICWIIMWPSDLKVSIPIHLFHFFSKYPVNIPLSFWMVLSFSLI